MAIHDLERKFFSICLFIFLLGLPAYSSAQRIVGSWAFYGLEGERIKSVAQSPCSPEILYAGTEDGDLYKSVDNGKTWVTLKADFSKALILAIAMPSTRTDTVYAGTSVGVFKSVDAGQSWEAVNTGLDQTYVQSLAIDPNIPMTIYAGTSGGIFKSMDGGQKWMFINMGLVQTNVQVVAVHPKRSSELYAGTWGGGVYKSTDSGATWNAVNSGLTNLNIRSLAIAPNAGETVYVGTDTNAGGGVFRTTDGGKTWTAMNNGIPQTGRLFFQTLAIDAAPPGGTIYAGTNLGIFHSQNNGEFWLSTGQGLGQKDVLTLSQAHGSVLVYAGTDSGLFALTTEAQPAQATQQKPSIPDASVTSSEQPAIPQAPGAQARVSEPQVRELEISQQQVTETRNAQTPQILGTRTTTCTRQKESQSASDDIACEPERDRTSDRVSQPDVTGVPGVVYAGTWGKGVFQYTEERGSWSARDRGLAGSFVQALAIDTSDPSTIYAATADSGVFISRDQGKQWESVNKGLPTTTVNALAIDPASSQTIYAGTDYGVFKSTNQGKSWSRAGMDLSDQQVQGLVIDPGQPGTVYASTYGGIYKTTDGGNYWLYLYTGLDRVDVEPLVLDSSVRGLSMQAFFVRASTKAQTMGSTGTVPVAVFTIPLLKRLL